MSLLPIATLLLLSYLIVALVRVREQRWRVSLLAWAISVASSWWFFRQIPMGDNGGAAVFWIFVLAAVCAAVGYAVGRKLQFWKGFVSAGAFAVVLSFGVIVAPDLYHGWSQAKAGTEPASPPVMEGSTR